MLEGLSPTGFFSSAPPNILRKLYPLKIKLSQYCTGLIHLLITLLLLQKLYLIIAHYELVGIYSVPPMLFLSVLRGDFSDSVPIFCPPYAIFLGA